MINCSAVAEVFTVEELNYISCAVPRRIEPEPDRDNNRPKRWLLKDLASQVAYAVHKIGTGLLNAEQRRANSAPFALAIAEAGELLGYIDHFLAGQGPESIGEAFAYYGRNESELRGTLERLAGKIRSALQPCNERTNLPVPLAIRSFSAEEMQCLSSAATYYVGPPFSVAHRRDFTPTEKLALDHMLDRMRTVRTVLSHYERMLTASGEPAYVPFAMTQLEVSVLMAQVEAVALEAADPNNDDYFASAADFQHNLDAVRTQLTLLLEKLRRPS
jgi:hypothetical protein